MSSRADVVVIGAGFAGLSAAVRLSTRGLKVLVLEQAPRLGGRASVFTDRETSERVDNGQHALFGCYTSTYAFLRSLGTDALAPLQPSLRVLMAATTGERHELACPRLPAPVHLVAGVLRWRALPARDRLSVVRLGLAVRRIQRAGATRAAAALPPTQTVTEWLISHGQSSRLREWLWNPLTIAALNQSPDAATAASFLVVLAELFGQVPQASSIGIARVPFDELYAEPAAALVRRAGGEVRLRTPARVVTGVDGAVRAVRAGDQCVETRCVISAVPWHGLSRIWEGDVPPALRGTVRAAAAMRSSPIVTVNLWTTGASTPAPFVGLVDGPMHWVFDKRAIVGDRAAHLSLVASGAEELVALDNAEVTRRAVAQLRLALPEFARASILRSVVVREPRATFSLAPGEPGRPGTRTALDGFLLAGDWTDTGLPATIEGAVRSGHCAADEALRARAS